MFRKGYVSSLEVEGQKFIVKQCNIELRSARTAKTILEEFTRAKMLVDLESQRDKAEAQLNADSAALALEETRLKRLQAQLAHCTIRAPQDGMVGMSFVIDAATQRGIWQNAISPSSLAAFLKKIKTFW